MAQRLVKFHDQIEHGPGGPVARADHAVDGIDIAVAESARSCEPIGPQPGVTVQEDDPIGVDMREALEHGGGFTRGGGDELDPDRFRKDDRSLCPGCRATREYDYNLVQIRAALAAAASEGRHAEATDRLLTRGTRAAIVPVACPGAGGHGTVSCAAERARSGAE